MTLKTKGVNFERTNFSSCMNAYTAALNEHKDLVTTLEFQGDTWYIAEYCCEHIRELKFGDVHYDADGKFDIIFHGYNLEDWFNGVDWSKKENLEALSNFIEITSFESYGEDFKRVFLSFAKEHLN